MDTVSHDDRRTAYRTITRGDPEESGILCVHGSGGTHDVWRAQLSRLSDSRPVTALDLSGHGDSPDIDAEPGQPTLTAYADDVLAVAKSTDASILWGNSLGGAVCLDIALNREFTPEALILLGTGARLAVLPDLLAWLQEDFERAISFLHAPNRLFHTVDEAYVESSREQLEAVGPDVTYRDFKTCDRFDVRDQLTELTIPTLAVTGEHDELTPPWYHEYLADEIPTATWETIPDAAHLSMLEQPARVNARIADWLASL